MTPTPHNLVVEAIRRHRMIQAGDRVGVGVSGGADSVALLLLLYDLRRSLGITLCVLHFHHQLRGAEADADQEFVAELARKLELQCIAQRGDVASHARVRKLNLEDAARRLRYAFFEQVVRAGRATRVAVAHTADDQAETVLAHLLRGTGLSGLAGIHPVAQHVLRPLLGVRRHALREFLKARQQPWREDQTNRDQTRLRARIRHSLLPLLEREFQSTAVERLATLAALARAEDEFWRARVEQLLSRCISRSADGSRIPIAALLDPYTFDRVAPSGPGDPLPSSALRCQEPCSAVSRRMVRRLWEMVTGQGQLAATHVEQVLRLATGPAGGGQVHLPGDVVVERTLARELVFFRRAGRTAAAPGSYEYVVPPLQQGCTQVDVREIATRFCLKVFDWSQAPRDTREREVVIDCDLLRLPLVLRNWRPGDVYCPKGHTQVRKVKRLFWEYGIDAWRRPGWPVLTSAGKPVWARGFPAAAEAAAGSATRRALVITEEPL